MAGTGRGRVVETPVEGSPVLENRVQVSPGPGPGVAVVYSRDPLMYTPSSVSVLFNLAGDRSIRQV
ncbi:hypothetical protein GCM10009771_20250 [Nesterenkonia flava]